jgi:hypothetical protein
MLSIPSFRILRQHRHPSRRSYGSLRSAWTGPVGVAQNYSPTREWTNLIQLPRSLAATASQAMTGREHTKRRILRSFMRSGLDTQPAFLVRGSSRRITIVRFQPADIRVIHRRHRFSSCHSLGWPSPSPPAKTSWNFTLDKVAPYQKMYFNPNWITRSVWRKPKSLAEVILPAFGLRTRPAASTTRGCITGSSN